MSIFFSRSRQQRISAKRGRRARALRLECLEERTLLSGGLTIAQENQLPGTPRSVWDVADAGDPSIQGYSTSLSVNQGETVSFKINDTAQAPYQIDIYRIGYYQGNGARLVATIPSSQTLRQAQPAPLKDPSTGMVDAGNWAVSASWAVPSDATSGVYIAHLTRQDNGAESLIIFVVRNDSSHSDILFSTSDATWEAYNDWGGNSLYAGTGPGDSGASYAVSYNRPLNVRNDADPDGSFFYAEFPMVEWMEQNGYDVTYSTNVDADRSGALMQNHKIYTSTGHDEYWSANEFNNVTAARDAGVNLAFFSGNSIFWKTYYAPSIDGSNTPSRSLVCYKESHANAILNTNNPSVWTGAWADPTFSATTDGGIGQNQLTGTFFNVNRGSNFVGSPISVSGRDAALRFWRNTDIANLSPNQSMTVGGQVLGYEWDSDIDNGFRPAGLMDMSSTTMEATEVFVDWANIVKPATVTHSLTLYRASGGALVFSAGTVQWSWGLNSTHDGHDNLDDPDPNMQQATVNLFADMGVQPVTLQAGLVLATASTDHTAPISVITSPASSVALTTGVPITITGTASDSGGGVVAGVEVSIDGGLSWHPAQGRNTWSYTWTPTLVGVTTIETRAVDDMATGTPAAGVSVTASQPLSSSVSLWNPTVKPALASQDDFTNSIDVGVQFTSDIAGLVSGIRFYKGLLNTGVHVGQLWTLSGTLLATATFSGETPDGWQQVNFSSPVQISPGTVYVASYFSPQGTYAVNTGYFSSPYSNGPLHVLTFGGVYAYGSGNVVPSNSNLSANYWVDVVFSSNQGPTLSAETPLPGATNVSTATTITATFDKAVQAGTISFAVTDSAGGTVAGSVSYNASNFTATFTPSAPLASATQFTATVSGAKDTSGLSMNGPASWSFTTFIPDTSSIWNNTTTPVVAAANDSAAIEVGVRFTADVAGTILGIRFYKGTGNTGNHVGDLWTNTGTLLATASFTNESTTGWQQVNFSTPVTITPGTVYVASYYAPAGHYAADASYFASTGVDNAPLHALSNAAGNGVYRYGNGGGFPLNSFNATNYWVDVVFKSGSTTDTTPPSVTAQTPTPGSTGVSTSTSITATFSEAVQPSTVAFVLSDASGNVIPGSLSYNSSTQTENFTPTTALNPSVQYTATISGAKDIAGNPMTSSVSWPFLTAATSTSTIWSPSVVPTVASANDNSAVELGVKFVSDVAGSISGIRFYKGSANTGTHVGHLWTSNGTLLATATFSAGSTTGWQQVTFANPVQITANTIYVASYYAPNGGYSADSGYFANAGFDNNQLHALSNAQANGNGVYRYGTGGGFPTSTFNSTNYWVDVVFSQNLSPTVTSVTPATGSSGVSLSASATATFSVSIQAGSLSFVLTGPNNTTVPATLGYNDTTHTATLTPNAALASGTLYTASVSGAMDALGNVMAAPFSWSFTTDVAPTVTSVAPAAGASNVSLSASATATFSVSIQAASLSFVLTGPNSTTVPATVSYNDTTHAATLTPNAALAAGTLYTATVSGAKDAVGTAMAAPFSWSFTTDVTPTVTSVAPATGASGVALSAVATATFSVSIQAASLSFVLTGPNSTTVPATVSYNDTTHTATLTPNAALAAGTPYTATVSGAKDAVGTAMAAPFSWSFTTITTSIVPSVTSVTPVSGAINVALTAPETATFNESILAASLSFVLTGPNNTTVPATVSYNDTTHIATLTPNAALAAGTVYTATVSGATDAVGTTMASPFSWSFTTDVAPTVTSVAPAAGASSVALSAVATATFSVSIQSASLSFVLTGPNNTTVPATVSYNDTTHIATLTPNAALAAGTVYTAKVSGAKDAVGTAMAAPFSWSFTTDVAPTVTSVAPAAGASSVALSAVATATFSVSIQAASLSFVLTGPNNTTVPATVSYNDTTHIATLTPNAALTAGTVYTAKVSGAKDAVGTAMAAPFSWSFTTDVAPTVTSVAPAAGASSVALSAVATATFSVSIQAASLSFVLTGPNSTTVPATVSYNDTTHTATLTPNAALTSGTVYTATVSGAKDAVGTAMTSPVSWSFTTLTTAIVPTVTSVTPVSGAINVAVTARATATFNVSIQAASLAFVLTTQSNTVVLATLSYNNGTRTATLTPRTSLAAGTIYTATVSGAKDALGTPMAGAFSWSFTTAGVTVNTWKQTSSSDFAGGTNSGTSVLDIGGGEVDLTPATYDGFAGTSLGTFWTVSTLAGGGKTTVAAGVVSVRGAQMLGATATTSPFEGSVSFGSAANQNFGLATGLATVSGNSWAIFSTMTSTNTLFARVNAAGVAQNVSLGTLPSGFHTYKILPTGSSIQFYIDGTLKTTLTASIPSSAALRPVLSALSTSTSNALKADWVRVDSYPASATFTSSTFDAGQTAAWGVASFTSSVPAGTSLIIETSSSADGTSWSSWNSVSNGGVVTSPAARYLRYRVRMATTDPSQTPTLSDISFQWFVSQPL